MFGSSPLSAKDSAALRSFARDFGQPEIDELAALEATTRHDVKAVEYLVRSQLHKLGLDHISELTHFACTSEDINNLSYAMTIRDAMTAIWLPALDAVIAELRSLAIEHRAVPMLCRTHGQPATPSTLGKEMAVFVYRLDRVRRQIAEGQRGAFVGETPKETARAFRRRGERRGLPFGTCVSSGFEVVLVHRLSLGGRQVKSEPEQPSQH
jgi:adenylosuccinate lyase